MKIAFCILLITLALVSCLPSTTAIIPQKHLFTIQIEFSESITVSQRKIFSEAAKIWQDIIVMNVKPIVANVKQGKCLDNESSWNGTVYGLVILATTREIDGKGGALGRAGPCLISKQTKLPYYAAMEFDSADILDHERSGSLKNLILHEIGHTLGIGTLWNFNGLITNLETDNPTYIGKNALIEWRELSSKGSVPIENIGGEGTRFSHWRELTFGSELMTGFAEASNVEEISRMTIASLIDLGYEVDLSKADSYFLPESKLRTQKELQSDLSQQHFLPLDKIFIE